MSQTQTIGQSSKPQKRIKKSKEAYYLSESVKYTLNLFYKEAERAIFISIPEQIKELDKLQDLPYIYKDFEKMHMYRLYNLQDLNSAIVCDKCLLSPYFLFPAVEFAQAETQIAKKVNELTILVNIIRRSIETLYWKRKSVIQEETQQLIIQYLKVSETNLQYVTGLFVQYHDTRADIIHTCYKHRLVDSFIVLLIVERKVCRALRDFVSDFKIHLIMLYAILIENFDKINGIYQASAGGAAGMGMM